MRWDRVMAVTGMLCALGLTDAEAHMRDYLVNQSYHTTKKHEVELEVWTDYNLTEAGHDGTYNFKQQDELEYGLTDRWQWAYYEVFTWNRKDDFERDEFKIETKYRLLDSGVLPVDVAVYGEYANPNGRRDDHSDELEGKLILSRDVGPLNLVSNLIAEKTINTHSDWEFAYTLGASYALTPRTRVGLEWKETLGDSDEFGIRRRDHKAYLIPELITSLTDHVRVGFGIGFGLTHPSDDLQFKSLVEVEF